MVGDRFPNSNTRHGTPSGWTLHQELGERPCTACYQARAAYDARRNQEPKRRDRALVRSRAQARALSELRRRYPDEYRELYERFKGEADG